MKYELVVLEKLMDDIKPALLDSLTKFQVLEKGQTWAQIFQNERERICSTLQNGVFNATDSKTVEVYIQQHQRGINAIAETLLEYMQSSRNVTVSKFYSQICTILENLLTYILNHFDKYFDINQPVPHSYRIMARDELKVQLQEIMDSLASANVKPELSNIALNPIQQFIENTHEITYRTLNYYKELVYQLLLLHQEKEVSYMVYNYHLIKDTLDEIGSRESKTTVKLNILLLYMNFNSPDFVAFCIAGLRSKYDDLPDFERLRIMKIYSKFLRQIRSKPGYSLMPELKDSASEQVRFWLEQEIEFLQSSTTVQTNGHNGHVSLMPSPAGIKTHSKIQLNASVAEFALLVRTAMEANIIGQMPPMELLRGFASLFNTLGTDGISLNNLKNNYFNPKKSAASTDIQKLQGWIKVLRKYE